MKEQDRYFSEDLVVKVGKQICYWLACAGATEDVHGNIHPANFVLFEDGRLEFERMSAEEEFICDTDGRPDYAYDVQALGRLLWSTCTHEPVENIEGDNPPPIPGTYSLKL